MATTDEPDSETVTTFGLSEVIAALARDLKKAQAQTAKGDTFAMYLGSVEVELQFVVQRTVTKSGRGGIGFKVFGIGDGVDMSAMTGSSEETVHRISLALIPKLTRETDKDGVLPNTNLDLRLPLGLTATSQPRHMRKEPAE